MSFNIDKFALIAGLLVAGGWFLFGVARLQATWVEATHRAATLKRQQVGEAKELYKNAQEILGLEEEIKTARDSAATAARQEAERKKALPVRAAPSPSRSITRANTMRTT